MAKQEDTTSEIRRKLLKAVVYAPPVILGSMVATPRTVMGAVGAKKKPKTKTCTNVPGNPIITISTGTNACCPCVLVSYNANQLPPIPSTPKDILKCEYAQCIKSCGVTCTPAAIAKIINKKKCKSFCKVCGGMPANMAAACNCTCVKTPGKKKC